MADSAEKLTERQVRAVAALLATRNVPEAAQAAHVGARTLYRWLTIPEFKTAVAAAEGEAISAAARRVVGLQSHAIAALESVLLDSRSSGVIKIRAATAILDFMLKLRELSDVEQRLVSLEQKASSHNH